MSLDLYRSLLAHIDAGDVIEDQSGPLTAVFDTTGGGEVPVTAEFVALYREGLAASGPRIDTRLFRTELTDAGRAVLETQREG